MNISKVLLYGLTMLFIVGSIGAIANNLHPFVIIMYIAGAIGFGIFLHITKDDDDF